jgi:L-lactate dehydrogenase complex protein LldG
MSQPSDARTEVLDRIRAAIAKSPTDPAVTRAYRTRGEHEPGSAALVDLLEDRLLDYKAGVHRTTADQIDTAVRAALDRHVPTGRIVVPPGLPDEWTSGRDVLRDDGGTSTAELDTVAAVVTACAVAVAETGTIVLDAGPDQGRRALSLVPDVHVCIVQVAQIVQTCPRRRPPRPPPSADLDQRPLSHQRHRAEPGRGCARPAQPRGRAGSRRALAATDCRPPPIVDGAELGQSPVGPK